MVQHNWGDLQEFYCCCCCILHWDCRTGNAYADLSSPFPLALLSDLLCIGIPAHNSSLGRVLPQDRAVLGLSAGTPACASLLSSPSHSQAFSVLTRRDGEQMCPKLLLSVLASCHLRWPQKGLCRDPWLEGTAGYWAAVATGMFNNHQRGLWKSCRVCKK